MGETDQVKQGYFSEVMCAARDFLERYLLGHSVRNRGLFDQRVSDLERHIPCKETGNATMSNGQRLESVVNSLSPNVLLSGAIALSPDGSATTIPSAGMAYDCGCVK